MKRHSRIAVKFFVCALCCTQAFSSASSAEWHAQWGYMLPERKGAWESTQRMPVDRGYPVATNGELVVVGCEHNGGLLALDATSGEARWRFYTEAPIRVAPVADGERVYVGSDDGMLYCLDTKGKLQWSHRGGPSERWVIGHERLMSAWPVSTDPLLHDGVIYYVTGYWPVDGVYVHALDAKTGEVRWTNASAQFRPRGEMRIDDGKLLIEGFHGKGAFDLATGQLLDEKLEKPPFRERPEVKGIEGNLSNWSQAGKFLAVGTDQGVFGLKQSPAESRKVAGAEPAVVNDSALAQKVLETAAIDQGYCLVLGAGDAEFIASLVRHSNLHIVAVDSNAQAITDARAHLDAHRLFDSHRLSLVAGKLEEVNLPPYFASLIVANSESSIPDAADRLLRPHGGKIVATAGNPKVVRVRNDGPKGSDDWSHEFQNAANTLSSNESLVRAPLGVLWYGGPAADARFYFDGNVDHQSGHGLNPQPVPAMIVDGRMFLQGPGLLGAIDIYTGRVLWESPLPSMYTYGGSGGGLGKHSKKHPEPWKYEQAMKFDVNPTERARASGFDMVVTSDTIYVAAGQELLRFDPATGQQISQWQVPIDGENLCWGNVRVVDDVLVATAFRPEDLVDAQAGHDGNGGDWAGDRMPMSWLVALNRNSGNLKWKREADWGFVNRSGIAAGGGKIFCVDLLTRGVLEKFKEAGRNLPAKQPTLYALDLNSGDVDWQFPLDVYVQNIAYSDEHDLLIVPCRNLREWKDGEWQDALSGRGRSFKNVPGRMRALQADTGEIVWQVEEAPYHTPQIILGDLIIDRYGFTYELLSGKRHERTSPITGEPQWWSFRKGGCNHLVACENLVTWRTAYYDLEGGSGVMQLSGMDAGCSPTLLPAGGVLNVPNFGTHHKRNRMTAMALVHRPENPMWTQYATSREKLPPGQQEELVERVGFNFGAPGDRVADDGTLWLQVTPRYRNNVSLEPKQAASIDWPSERTGSWVASSALVGMESLKLPITAGGESTGEAVYTVRLHFAEIEDRAPGERVFSVHMAEQSAIDEIDVAKEAGGQNRPIIRELKDVHIKGALELEFNAKQGESIISGIELIRQK